MSSIDKDIFNLLDGISDDEKMKLLDLIDLEETNMEEERKNKIKNNVMHKVKDGSLKSTKKVKRGLIAAGIALCLILSGFTPFGQKALAEVAKKLYFIPGIGKTVENKGHDIFILPTSIKASLTGNNVTISSITKDCTRMIIRLYSDYALGSKLTVEDEKGNLYVSSASSTGQGNNFLGMYDFSNMPEQLNSFKIVLSKDSKIPVVLKMAESYADYNSMGPTDVKNDIGITLVPRKLGDKIQFDLIQHQTQNRQVSLYGKDDTDGHSHINVLVKDYSGKSYALDYPKSYAGTLSEFEFTPDSSLEKYIVQIPEITLKYKVDNEITLPMPKEGETQVGKVIEMHGFSFKITRIFREGIKVIVYVDTNFNENKPENLSFISLDMGAIPIDMYKWKLNNHITTESYEFNINPGDRKLKIKFNEMYTILKGPWTFEINDK
jgi:hypothetical protein